MLDPNSPVKFLAVKERRFEAHLRILRGVESGDRNQFTLTRKPQRKIWGSAEGSKILRLAEVEELYRRRGNLGGPGDHVKRDRDWGEGGASGDLPFLRVDRRILVPYFLRRTRLQPHVGADFDFIGAQGSGLDTRFVERAGEGQSHTTVEPSQDQIAVVPSRLGEVIFDHIRRRGSRDGCCCSYLATVQIDLDGALDVRRRGVDPVVKRPHNVMEGAVEDARRWHLRRPDRCRTVKDIEMKVARQGSVPV